MKNRHFIIALFIIIGILIYLIDPTSHKFVPQCPFRLITGWSCPGCGLQRATHAALHGRLYEAIQYNWFLVFSLPYAFGLMLAQWGPRSIRNSHLLKLLSHRYAIYTYIFLFFVWGVARNMINI